TRSIWDSVERRAKDDVSKRDLPVPLAGENPLTQRFADLDLKPELKRVLDRAGYLTCTPIQELALPDALAGHDIIGVAKTGTGKTVAFLLPIFQALEPGADVQALVICPTRELALQVGGEAEKLGKPIGVRTAVLYGGTSL